MADTHAAHTHGPSHHGSAHGHAHGHGGGHGHVGHIVPTWLLAAVLAALLVLTVITVAVRAIDLGRANIWIAMLIATVKAALVGLYFMHLRWDRPFNAIVLIASLGFVALFIIFSMMDTGQYQGDLLAPPPVTR
jgi:cytochrome c oxidase subunit 4